MRYLIANDKAEPMIRYEDRPDETTCLLHSIASLLRCTPQQITDEIGVCPNYLKIPTAAERLSAYKRYYDNLLRYMWKRGYQFIVTYAADAGLEKKIHRGRCYLVTIHRKGSSLEPGLAHSIVVDEEGNVLDPTPPSRMKFNSLSEYESPSSEIHQIMEIVKVEP